MTRRELLKLAAVAALTPIATRLEPVRTAFLQETKLSTFLVSFPDGTEWSFQGYLTKLSKSEMTIAPQGAMKLSRDLLVEPVDGPIDAQATLLTLDDIAIGPVEDVSPPSSSCSLLDVTSNHRPDLTWRFLDAQGHAHRWYVDGQPAIRYSPTERYETPTLVWVHDGTGIYEDGSEYEIGHHECPRCQERIEPRYTADTEQQFTPGLRRMGTIVIHGKFA